MKQFQAEILIDFYFSRFNDQQRVDGGKRRSSAES